MDASAQTVSLRRLRRGERHPVVTVFAGLSERSRRLRFLGPVHRLTERQLDTLVDVGCCGREALVASEADTGRPIGIGRYVRDDHHPETAEVAFAVVDAWQGRGVGRRLALELARVARAAGVTRLRATVASENRAAVALLHRVGTVEHTVRDGATMELTLSLTRPR